MLKKFRKMLEKQQLTGYLIAKKENVRYISGYSGEDVFLLITLDKQYLVTDPRYLEQVSIECPDYELINWRLPGQTVGDGLAKIINQEKLQSVGFESDYLNYEMATTVKEQITGELLPQPALIESLRQVKTLEEQDKLRIACDIACRAFERILNDIKVGVTEKELAAKLALYMVQAGADTKPYGNILISGTKTSLLHGIPSEKAIAYGDFVLLDFGCQYQGYLSDMTRTVVVGRATAKQKEVYRLEQEMMVASLKAVKAGASISQCYEASIKPIKETPYFAYHYPNIGHSIGLALHEHPMITHQNQEAFKVGQVVTIEPGLYLPSWGGVRIEDQVIVTEEGYENLVWITHDLIEL